MLRAICPAVALSASLALAAPPGALLEPASGAVVYVSKSRGDNSNDGSREKPLKEIDKAVAKAKPGDTIAVAAGVYMGTFNIGFVKVDKALKLYGGFSDDFSDRDVIKHGTYFQPDNASGAKSREALLSFSKLKGGVVLDGFIIDMGLRNAYSTKEGKPAGVETGLLQLPPAVEKPQVATVEKPCVYINSPEDGDVTISNNVFANCANYGVQANGLKGGTVRVVNRYPAAKALPLFGANAQAGAQKPQ